MTSAWTIAGLSSDDFDLLEEDHITIWIKDIQVGIVNRTSDSPLFNPNNADLELVGIYAIDQTNRPYFAGCFRHMVMGAVYKGFPYRGDLGRVLTMELLELRATTAEMHSRIADMEREAQLIADTQREMIEFAEKKGEKEIARMTVALEECRLRVQARDVTDYIARLNDRKLNYRIVNGCEPLPEGDYSELVFLTLADFRQFVGHYLYRLLDHIRTFHVPNCSEEEHQIVREIMRANRQWKHILIVMMTTRKS
jgi:hypothetical protein